MLDTHNQAGAATDGGLDLTQFYQVFFEEAGENLANMETLLLGVDVGAPSDDDLNAIFRCAHSIKGGAATFGFQDVADLTHVMETLLDRLRRHELAVTTPMIDTLLESGDALRALLARQQGTSTEPVDTRDLVARIRALAEGREAPATPPAAAPAPAAPAPAPAAPAAASPAAAADGERVLCVTVDPQGKPETVERLAELFRDIPGLGTIEPLDAGTPDAQGRRRFRVVTRSGDAELLDLFTFHVRRDQVVIGAPEAAPATTGAAPEAPGYGFFVVERTLPGARDAATRATPAASSPAGASGAGARTGAGPRAERPAAAAAGADSATTLRVSIEKVDQLINLVGELVINQAMLAQTGRDLDPVRNQAMLSGLVDLERNTRSLQEAVMAIRMIPMAVVFNRFPRMLRDLAGKLGKQVELHTIGEDTELDKGLIEKITDPLTHLVRNSADHGIESPAERVAAGKPAHGTITLSAAHQGGEIVIEVRDDGKGLARDKILAKAAERGLPVHDAMTDAEVWQLIFEPGFSTAAQVTDVSGRGVGMDVVKRNIASLNGKVELESVEGVGTRVSVRLPLTLAIMDGMSVGVAEETYIVPIANVIESIHLDPARVRTVGGSGRVVEVRGEYLPLVALEGVFDVPRERAAEGAGIMVVVEAEGARVALLVDELIGQHQVVVKNLESNYRKVPGASGATILGDGRVALILDVAWMVQRARG